MQVALSLLKDGCQPLQRQLETGRTLEAGAVLRYTGVYAGDAMKETEPVTFVSVPYMTLGDKRRSERPEDFQSLTLLQSLYGYDVGDEREGNQVIQKTKRAFAKKTVYVPQLWCLMIGQGMFGAQLSQIAS